MSDANLASVAETMIEKRSDRNYIAGSLAIAVTGGLLVVIAILPFVHIPEGNEKLFRDGFTTLCSLVSMVFGVFVGSKKG